jgi:hypothetical protein
MSLAVDSAKRSVEDAEGSEELDVELEPFSEGAVSIEDHLQKEH